YGHHTPIGSVSVQPRRRVGSVFLLVMLQQQILAEIAALAAPHGMYMVALVLDQIVFEEKIRAFQPVIMRLAFLGAAKPDEAQIVDIDLAKIGAGDFRAVGGHHFIENALYTVLLRRVEFAHRDALRWQSLPIVPV